MLGNDIPEHEKDYNKYKYLVQVWDDKGKMVYEKHTACKVKKWWISEIQRDVDVNFSKLGHDKETDCKTKKTVFCFFEEEESSKEPNSTFGVTVNCVIIDDKINPVILEFDLGYTSFYESKDKSIKRKLSDYEHIAISQGHLILAGENMLCYVNLVGLLKSLLDTPDVEELSKF